MYDLLQLHISRPVNQASKFASFIVELDPTGIAGGYRSLMTLAPSRRSRSLPYFEGRTGKPRTGAISNRYEEHLALALYNECQSGRSFTLPNGRSLAIVDYQTPLKAKQSDSGIGKVDLFGIVSSETLSVIELKIQSASGQLADTPLKALLEGLAYCAIIEANGADIAAELKEKLDLDNLTHRPCLIVMAPEEYWRAYLGNPRTGDWLPAIVDLISGIRREYEIEVDLISIQDCEFEMGLNGKPPRLLKDCSLVSVESLVATR